jgi:hypothetical protein
MSYNRGLDRDKDRIASYSPAGPPRNTVATAPASAVSIAAATGAKMAAKGIRVGSVPVSITGSVMARIVATDQFTSVATDNPTQMGCQLERPRSRFIAKSKTRVPTPPQNQAVNAATGRCSCSEPETTSGAKRLISRTPTQIPPLPGGDDGVFYGIGVPMLEVGDDHHVLGEASRHGERLRKRLE